MSFAAVMVHVDLDAPCDARIRLAASLATKFQSTLMGISASQPPSPLTYGGVVVDPQPTPAMIHELSARLSRLGEHFNSVVGWNRQIEWRTGINSPTQFLAAEARAADLVIIGRDRAPGDFYRTLDPGALTLRAGRPVLVVPPDVNSLRAENVVVGWKEAQSHDAQFWMPCPFCSRRAAYAWWSVMKPAKSARFRMSKMSVAISSVMV